MVVLTLGCGLLVERAAFVRLPGTLLPHLAKGYPMGAVIPIGVGRQIVGGDVLWLYHPCVAWVAAMLALALYELAARVVSSRWLRGLAAFIGAQSALMYGYALWG